MDTREPRAIGAHEDVLQWLSLDLDGELRERERILLSDHLSGCPRCEQVAEQMRAARRAIKVDARLRTPVGLVDRIVSRIERADEELEVAREPAPVAMAAVVSTRGFSFRLLRSSAALAAGLLLLVGGVFVAQEPKQAVATGTRTLDPDVRRILDRWQAGAAEPSFFELLFAPSPRNGR